MSDFERQYYEAAGFWENGMVADEWNYSRIEQTAAMIPGDVHSLADIGCGNGVFLHYLQQHRTDLQLMGLDRSEEALRHVKVNKVSGSIDQLPFSDKQFDCVTSLEVIEHLPVPVFKKALQEIARVADKHIIISVPFAEKLDDAFTRCPSCKSMFNVDLHFRSFSEQMMKGLLDEFGFQNTGIKKMGEIRNYKGHKTFRNIFYPQDRYKWASPICPLCGYTADTNKQNAHTENVQADTQHNNAPVKRSLVSYLTPLPKLIWPKETRYYWIAGVYKRI